jgi:tetratricopeptide (TPR) repeat protein
MRKSLFSTIVSTILLIPQGALAAQPSSVPLSARPLTVQISALGEPVDPKVQEARQLYKDGSRDYRLGRFKDAVEKWEKAYALSDLPLLLWNIGLGYKGLYSISGEISDLRKARAVLDNFLKLAHANPEVAPEADVRDAESQLAQIDKMLADAKKKQAEEAHQPEEPAPDELEPVEPMPPSGPDPGKPFRIGGIVSMAVGGALVFTGVLMGSIYGAKGTDFSNRLSSLRTEEATKCPAGPDDPSDVCQTHQANIDITRENGRKANLGMALSFGIAGGLGVAAVVAGVVVFVQGNRKTKAWRAGKASLRVVPMTSMTGMAGGANGLALSGRF